MPKTPWRIRSLFAVPLFVACWQLSTAALVDAAVQPVSFGAKTDFGTGGQPESVAVGDFNGDGKLDLAVANSADNTVSILLGTGTGSFGAKTNFGTGISPQSVAVGDFNGDGKLDLAVANDESNTVSILLGNGHGSFGAKTDFGTGSGPRTTLPPGAFTAILAGQSPGTGIGLIEIYNVK